MWWFLVLACHEPDVGVRTPGSSETAPVDSAPLSIGDTAPIGEDDDTVPSGDDDDTVPDDTDPQTTAPCPADMALVDAVCMDLYEAPNVAGADPLVMYTFLEAEDWCVARAKRLCTDVEWEAACEGSSGYAYPYGDALQAGVCNDEEVWRVYSQNRLNAWPSAASTPDVDSLAALLAAVRSLGQDDAADHIEELYQGEGGGVNAGCVGAHGVFDLVGNVEEWTRRDDGGTTSFHGNLKGRYWAESRTCQSDVTVHGDTFRFYEIGFRCCSDPS